MPFINEISISIPSARFTTGAAFSADGTVSKHFKAKKLFTGANLSAAPVLELSGAAEIETGVSFAADGRLNLSPNKHGAGVVETGANFAANGHLQTTGKVRIEIGANFSANPIVRQRESFRTAIRLTIAPDPAQSSGAAYSARIIADGAEIPISGFNFNDSLGFAAANIDFDLIRAADLEIVRTANEFTFQIYDGAAWQTVFESGKLSGVGANSAFSDGRAADRFSFNTSAPTARRLSAAPDRRLTIYDGNRLDLQQKDFPAVYDTSGVKYSHVLQKVFNLKLHKLFELIFINKCGFASVKTNIPNYPVLRADFDFSETYLSALGKHFGVFDPLIFAVADTLWIINPNAAFPPGFPPPVELTANLYKNYQLTETRPAADAIVLQYSENSLDFDYSIDRTDEPDILPGGEYGTPGYTETKITRTFRDYYRTSNPFAPVRSELIKTETEISANAAGLFQPIQTETETISLDAFNSEIQSKTVKHALLPELENPDNFTLQRTKELKTLSEYAPDPQNIRRRYLSRRVTTERGLYSIDAENPQLGKPFKQPIKDGLEFGNLNENLTTEFGYLKETIEFFKLLENGQIELRTRETSFLTDPPVTQNGQKTIRGGDVSQNSQTAAGRELIIWKTGAIERTDSVKETLSGGEIPLYILKPLANRKLELKGGRRGSVELTGLNLSLRRGGAFRLIDRNGAAVGNFIIEGMAISGANLGTFQQATKQILEVREI